jgi:hypothetical protein
MNYLVCLSEQEIDEDELADLKAQGAEILDAPRGGRVSSRECTYVRPFWLLNQPNWEKTPHMHSSILFLFPLHCIRMMICYANQTRKYGLLPQGIKRDEQNGCVITCLYCLSV